MENIYYKVWGWGPQTGQGSGVQHNVGVRTKAKRSLVNAYEVANEMFCWRLAEALKLPVPTGGVCEHDGALWYVSLDYSLRGENLPPATKSDLSKIVRHEWLTCGILLFDAWIVNEDRGKQNIRYDRETGSVYLIDHGRAMFCGLTAEKAVKDLLDYKNQIVVTHETHCLGKEVANLDDFAEWHQRIRKIPEYYILETLEQSVELGLPQEQLNLCFDFLLDRRDRLGVIFRDNHEKAFPKLKPTLFGPDYTASCPDYSEHADFI